jgi:hypothetical protein
MTLRARIIAKNPHCVTDASERNASNQNSNDHPQTRRRTLSCSKANPRPNKRGDDQADEHEDRVACEARIWFGFGHGGQSCLTMEAQRPGSQYAWIATATVRRGSLEHFVRPRSHGVE